MESGREKRRSRLSYLPHLLVKLLRKVSSVPLNNGHTMELPGEGFLMLLRPHSRPIKSGDGTHASVISKAPW